MSSEYDVLVIGAGPAGATAATILAREGHRVAMFDAAKFPRGVLCAGWLTSAAMDMLEELDVSRAAIAGIPIETVTFHNADFTKSATPRFTTPPSYLIDRAALDQKLVTAATESGATFYDDTRVTDIALGELSVTITLDQEHPPSATGRLLVFAAGRESALRDRLNLPAGSFPAGWWASQIEIDGVTTADTPTVAIVLGIDPAGGFGLIVTANGRATIGVHTPHDRSSVVSTLTGLCKNALEHGIIDVDAAGHAARTTPVSDPASVALAMDTHVAKRTLIIGDAGGFVSATSGEGIYPAIWSARIAAGVIAEALASDSPQDALMQFDTRWRTEMAGYLRAPNTDVQYILPLVFSNQPVADRMGAAFFTGENI